MLALLAVLSMAAGPARADDGDTFGPEEVLAAAEKLFGGATEGLGEVVEKVFAEQSWIPF